MSLTHAAPLSADHDTATSTSYRVRLIEPTSQASSLSTILATRSTPRRKVELPSRLEPIIDSMFEIIDLELLPPNWDGHGGLPATTVAIETALKTFGLHSRLLRRPLVAPRADGGVHIEWEQPLSLELDVEPDGLITVIVQQDDDWMDFEFRNPADPALHEQLAHIEA